MRLGTLSVLLTGALLTGNIATTVISPLAPWRPSNLLLCSLCPCPLFSVAQTVKCLPAMQETPVQSLGWEDLLEKKMAAHSNILAWKIPWTEELQSMGLQRVGHY